MDIPKKPLGLVTEIIEGMGLEVTYAYDDLVFISHSAFLIQFGEKNHDLNIFINSLCPDSDILILKEDLNKAFYERGFILYYKGKFDMKQKENEELEIKLINA